MAAGTSPHSQGRAAGVLAATQEQGEQHRAQQPHSAASSFLLCVSCKHMQCLLLTALRGFHMRSLLHLSHIQLVEAVCSHTARAYCFMVPAGGGHQRGLQRLCGPQQQAGRAGGSSGAHAPAAAGHTGAPAAPLQHSANSCRVKQHAASQCNRLAAAQSAVLECLLEESRCFAAASQAVVRCGCSSPTAQSAVRLYSPACACNARGI